jgi:hypothetical protein
MFRRLLSLTLPMTSSLLGAFLGEHISCTLTMPRSRNAICGCRVKFRLPYSLVAVEMVNSSANQMEQRPAWLE